MGSPDSSKRVKQGSLLTLQATLISVNDFITQSRFTETDQKGVYSWMLKIYYSNDDKAKFEELNEAISQNILDCNFAIGIANFQQNMTDAARKDSMTIKKALVTVLGGYHVRLDSESEVGAFLGEHRRIKSVLEGLSSMEVTDDANSSSIGAARSITATQFQKRSVEKLLSQLRAFNEATLVWDARSCPKLGQGAFATVYRGRYEGKDVAIKHFANLETVADVRIILKEAVVLQSIWHPNVLRSLGFSLDQGLLVSELAICSMSDLLYHKSSKRFLELGISSQIDSLLSNIS